MFESAASKYQCDSEEFSSAVRENKTAFNPIFDNKLLPGRFEPQQCRIIWFQAPVLGWCTGVFGGICFDSEMTNHVRYELRQHKAEKSAKTKWNCFAGGEKMSSLISGIGQCWKEKWRNKNGHGFWIWSFRITMLHDCVVRYVSLLDAMSVIHLMGTEIDWKRILRGLTRAPLGYSAERAPLGGGQILPPLPNSRTDDRRKTGKTANKSSQQDES